MTTLESDSMHWRTNLSNTLAMLDKESWRNALNMLTLGNSTLRSLKLIRNKSVLSYAVQELAIDMQLNGLTHVPFANADC